MHFDRTGAVCAMSPVVQYFPPLSDMGGAWFLELGVAAKPHIPLMSDVFSGA